MPFYQGLRWSLCTWATRMSLMSPCRVGRAGLPLPLGPTPCARLRVQSPLHLSSSASPNCLAHQLPVEKRSCHSCRTDKSQQTATVFTMVGLEAAGVLNVLEDSWLAHAPRLVPLPFEWSIYFFSTQSRITSCPVSLAVLSWVELYQMTSGIVPLLLDDKAFLSCFCHQPL